MEIEFYKDKSEALKAIKSFFRNDANFKSIVKLAFSIIVFGVVAILFLIFALTALLLGYLVLYLLK